MNGGKVCETRRISMAYADRQPKKAIINWKTHLNTCHFTRFYFHSFSASLSTSPIAIPKKSVTFEWEKACKNNGHFMKASNLSQLKKYVYQRLSDICMTV